MAARPSRTRRPTGCRLDPTNLAGTVSALPSRDQMPLDLNEQLVVEYYSR
jgi:ribosomal protein S4